MTKPASRTEFLTVPTHIGNGPTDAVPKGRTGLEGRQSGLRRAYKINGSDNKDQSIQVDGKANIDPRH
jgi:hypothetical protein